MIGAAGIETAVSETAEWCVDCGPGGPVLAIVYRMRVGHRLVPLCDTHAWERVPRDYRWLPPSPCVSCARSVIRASGVTGLYVYCGAACADVARRARQSGSRKQARVNVRPLRGCAGCGGELTPTCERHRAHNASCRKAAQRRRIAEQLASGGLLISRSERAHQGNPAWGIEWCPGCQENTDPRNGKCNWCGALTRPLFGGDRHVAVAA
jgi:hypothetical protein